MKNITTILIFLLFILNSCFLNKKSNLNQTNETETSKVDSKEQYPQAIIGDLPTSSDPFKLLSVEFDRNYIIFEISYIGGCGLHDFKLFGSPELSKSSPPIRQLKIYHNKNGDQCKSIVTEKFKFAISILSVNYSSDEIKLYLLDNQKTYSFRYIP
jgi:hypothetical protein